tara:strand:- start:950 stop:1405 length:456 start_codon:yes stop_codon:yes gene_type:complete
MDIVEQKQDQAIYNIIKVYLAQMNSAMKISKIICEHSSDDSELTGDHIICGLIYRLMVPMTDEDMNESLNKADNILNDSDDESDGESDEEISYEIPKEKRKLKINDCNCDICVKCRECVAGYESYETYDPMVTRFKDSIKETCDKHNIYIN